MIICHKLPVSGNNIKKCLDPGLKARISGVAVQFKGQRWLPAHDGSEIPDNKRIRTARKVGYKCAEKLWVFFNKSGRFQYQLAHAPVHVALGFFFFKGQEIHGNGQNSAGREFMGDPHVGLFNKCIVWTAEHYNRRLFRVGLKIGKYSFADLFEFSHALFLL